MEISRLSPTIYYTQKEGDIMDPTAVTTFIQTLGFPIACVVYLFYAQQKERESHEQESKAWTEALHNNTLAITQLTDFIKAQQHE